MFLMLASALASAATPSAPASGASQAAPAPTPATAERRYCVVTVPTGSRLERRDCRTRAEWLREGFDPLARD